MMINVQPQYRTLVLAFKYGDSNRTLQCAAESSGTADKALAHKALLNHGQRVQHNTALTHGGMSRGRQS